MNKRPAPQPSKKGKSITFTKCPECGSRSHPVPYPTTPPAPGTVARSCSNGHQFTVLKATK